MGRYFKPLRRKVGILTLVIACLFMAGWLRSLYVCDSLSFYKASSTESLWSSDGTIAITWDLNVRFSRLLHSRRLPFWNSDEVSREFEGSGVIVSETDSCTKWRWKVLGFGVGDPNLESEFGQTGIWQAPYWSIILPSIVLSSWLLLSKPKHPKPTSDPPV